MGWHADEPPRTGFALGGASLSVVAGIPAENARVAFAAGAAETLHDPDGNVVEFVELR